MVKKYWVSTFALLLSTSQDRTFCIAARRGDSRRYRPWRAPWPRSHAATIGSIRVGSSFLTLPTRALTGQQVIAPDGWGARRALSSRGFAGSSPSQAGHTSGATTAGIRLRSSAQSAFGLVVAIAKLRIHSPAGERQFLS